MIVGTAGHIDHGKTTLVRALTGVDTDRLKEEKERGISIELGYAYVPLDNGDVLGFVDVPGHEKLVHTMVAGACGIDFALLVVAADDGVMPQTREHVAIFDLLGVTQGAVALSKIDRVDGERVRFVEGEIASLLAPTALRGAPIFALNATALDDPGTASLREHLRNAAARLPSRGGAGLFRLAVDRVFTLPGHGTIVAGTVFAGRVAVGDTVAVMPSSQAVRVRSIHAQNRSADVGYAGQRCALNLAGVEKSAVARGDWLADPRALSPTTRIDVQLKLLRDCGARLGQWSTLHIHIGTAHRVAHVVPLETERLSAGESGRAQLVFDAPICATPGDRFIVRDAQAAHTIGGGSVLDPFAPARKRRSVERSKYLDALARMIAGDGIAPLLAQAHHGVRLSDLATLTGNPPNRLSLPDDAIVIDGDREGFAIRRTHLQDLRDRALAALRDFHTQYPDEAGADIGRLRRIAAPDLPQAVWRALIDTLAREQAVMRSGPWLHLPQHAVTLSDNENALAQKLLPLLAAGRFDPPWVRDLAVELGAPEEQVRSILPKLVTRGAVHQVVRDLFYDSGRIGELADILAALAREHDIVEARRYRDAIGLGRKRTIQILEFFDRVGYTRRVGDSHILRRDSGWRSAGREIASAR
jgi:selenocysteine-specific elongation factor